MGSGINNDVQFQFFYWNNKENFKEEKRMGHIWFRAFFVRFLTSKYVVWAAVESGWFYLFASRIRNVFQRSYIN